MSFFKKIKDELKEMLKDDDDKDKQKQQSGGQLGFGSSDQYQPQRDLNQAPNTYSQYPPYQQGPPGQNSYNSPPPPNADYPPPQNPPLPPGWISQFDHNSQRWYYIYQPTGQVQWEFPGPAPGVPPPAPAPGFQQSYGQAMPSVPYMPGHNENSKGYYTGSVQPEKKGSGMGGVIAGGLGGAAVGALVGHALNDSDSDNEGRASAAGAGYDAAPGAYGAPPGVPPASADPPLEFNPDLSSSQRSSLQEARESLEEQRAKVAEDSSPSSSDIEDLREAEEEYASEVESAQEELED
ncbi:hypothetical protein H2204_010467 [Knufia peltigerae]|uniref:WW domain-containing protein n=1 Tax=Knufia peltigerae TaxID=1002370 RepID=A0AA38XW79_9EURO|nr:hypothetical protein H2204_010467 [Knufia peltigerae]